MKNCVFHFSVERDPKKRRVKPVECAPLLEFDLEESSDDSDFRIEDHYVDSDDDSLDSIGLKKGELKRLANKTNIQRKLR